MLFVILESPFAGDIVKNEAYAKLAMRDSLLRGEAPFASHLLYTQKGILDDSNLKEREMGIEAGLYIGSFADMTVVYIDLGISSGMQYGIDRAKHENRKIVYRTIL